MYFQLHQYLRSNEWRQNRIVNFFRWILIENGWTGWYLTEVACGISKCIFSNENFRIANEILLSLFYYSRL